MSSPPHDSEIPLPPLRTPSISRLRKIPPIPARQKSIADVDEGFDSCSGNDPDRADSNIIGPSMLGLNQIRTRSAPLPLDQVICLAAQQNFEDLESQGIDGDEPPRPKISSAAQRLASNSMERGRRVHWSHSKSLKVLSPRRSGIEGYHAALAKEMQSPRFQAILRLTSGRKKRAPDIKSFSHELDSKGVRPLPFWKSRAIGRMEEIMVMIRVKFDKLKGEVDADLGIFAGDLVSVLEKTSKSRSKECLEDLLLVARQCATMSADDFWIKCEGIVQNLDDRRQELPTGTLKQVHTRLLFILSRCTRLVHFQKEIGYEEDFATSHQLSDLGVYPERFLGSSSGIKESRDKHTYKVVEQKQSNPINNQGHATEEVSTATSIASSPGSFRMSSWKKLPSAAEKNRRGHGTVDSPCKDKPEGLQHKKKVNSPENTPSAVCQVEHATENMKSQRVGWGAWDQPHMAYEDSLICRICEVEIPTVHVEQHSRICTIADRCDLKGLTVNERLERVAETLEKVLESWTPKGSDEGFGSPEVVRESASCAQDDLDGLSPKGNSLSCRCPEDMMDYLEAESSFSVDDLHSSLNISCDSRPLTPDQSKKASSAGSLTPRSPLVTPRMTQIEFLLSGRRTISEQESYQQIRKVLDIARSVVIVNKTDYSTLEFMLDKLDDLKYAIHDRKVDALVVETFGRRIEKLIQEKYVSLCGQIDDEKAFLQNTTVDEDSSTEEETSRSLRASPINTCTKDRTSIEDFEIIKPISRGAFGRVFLARKRATGDLFAIKVLKKADMIRKNAVESILAERDILISVRNPFVVRFFYSFTCRENLYLVMEYLNGGDLFSMLRNLGCLDEDITRVYIAEVVLALEYMHSLNVIHRDLKPDNLLIGPDGHIKVNILKSQSSQKREQRKKTQVVGTPDYLAPEILLGMGHGVTADWWSVGVILFELLVGIPPFNAEHPQEIFNNIINRDITWPKVPEEISFEAYDLINKLLIENPVQRLGATGAAEVKRHPFFKDINWGTLARQKAAFIPSADLHDTSYFMSRYIWNLEEENAHGGSDCDDMTDTGSGSRSSSSYLQDEDGDECGNLADFGTPSLEMKYSFSNFSFKNLSQLASINYDLVTRNKESG
ncbi:AGC cGMP-dependent and protein kinase kinase family protein [Perilla frutescens var. hirtella]|nr:AGC cGMP-dependent and protein kinase kinase family protein [Perilla frutescens var. hirtella]